MKSCWMDYWTGSDKNLTNEGGSRSGYGTWKRYQNRDHRAPIGLNRFSGNIDGSVSKELSRQRV